MGLYAFEEAESLIKDFRGDQAVDSDTREFAARLIGSENAKPEHWPDLRPYVVANHAAVRWYIRRRKKKRNLRTWYAVLSIGLLLAIPALIFWISTTAGSLEGDATKGSANVWLAQATAIGTGLIAAYRAIAAWLDKSFAASNFTQAAAELKGNIYAFEEQWKGKALGSGAFSDEFKNALTEGIRAAREIVRKQRDAYFAASAPPSVNLVESLQKASKDTSKLFETFQSPDFARALQEDEATRTQQTMLDKLRGEIAELSAQNQALGELIKRKEEELANEADAARKKTLETFLSGLKSSRDTNEKSLAENTGKLTALVASA